MGYLYFTSDAIETVRHPDYFKEALAYEGVGLQQKERKITAEEFAQLQSLKWAPHSHNCLRGV